MVCAPFNNSNAVFNACLREVFAKSSRELKPYEYEPGPFKYVFELNKYALELIDGVLELMKTHSNY